MHSQLVARFDRLAEFHAVDRHKQNADFLVAGIFTRSGNHQSAGRLSHRFDLQNARHNRIAGEMSLEKLFIHGHVLYADALFAGNFDFQPVHQQKGIAVRQKIHDIFNVVDFVFGHIFLPFSLVKFIFLNFSAKKPPGA